MSPILLLVLPWVALFAFLALWVRIPRELDEDPPTDTPLVSVIVPARDEAANIYTCLGSLTTSRYPAFEVVVIDDGSLDGTGEIARRTAPGNARHVRVVDGSAIPRRWLGKPWACAQGARLAEGELLLFTDADTIHGPDLLGRAVACLHRDRADAVTVAGRQLMETFWERLVQPQIFLTMVLRFFDLERSLARGRWRDAIANGQFLLFRREAYEALGGHEAVRSEVVEDLAFAQLLVRRGMRLSARMGEDALSTRMYRSLGHLVEGWSKNLLVGAKKTLAPGLRPWIAPSMVLWALTMWILPPVVLVAAVAGLGGTDALSWSVAVVAVSIALWGTFTHKMGGPAWYGLFYPLGAMMGLFILFRAWIRGRRVEWKGREYVLDEPTSDG
ncbi:MAG: glycosyltransferase family 2 protein [Gemmatimonadetes bacterium]|nr:glycosyltransferase family 2 protein [Gemmatimonadota bacterium]